MIRKKLLIIIFTSLLASLMSLGLKPKASLGAERISFYVPVFGEFDLSVDSLEVFAKEGTITPEFNFYASRFDRETLDRFRQALQKKFDVSPALVSRLTKMHLGEQFLKQMGEVVYTHPNRNGLYAIRSALILAAADAEGLTPINFLRHFPTSEIQLNTNLIFSLMKEVNNFSTYSDTTTKAIAEKAKIEAAEQSEMDFDHLPDLRKKGNHPVTQKTMTFEIERVRQTQLGFSLNYSLEADIYLPQNLQQPAPLVILSHGFISARSNFIYLAKHLASHGYIVIAPEHVGSNSKFKEAFLRGEISVEVSPFEFYSRPLDITLLLNQIEEHAELQELINWQQVGILGHSFGGQTALVVSGAPLNYQRLNQVCQQNRPTLNVSMLLQCRASYLPPGDYNMRDSRIKAVAVISPVTSSILGPESMSQITIPTMILGGSEDIVTPFIEEQVHPFLWLTTQHKYLGVMDGGSHNSTSSYQRASKLPKSLKGVRPDLGRNYLQAMSLAFFDVHLRDRANYQPYLSSAYTQTISNQELPLHLIKSLTAEELEFAYGKTPPTPPIPETIVAVSPRKQKNILAEIQESKTLKIAMRSDAAPFGYIDPQNGLWTGYCENLADSLGNYLAEQLNIPSGIEVIKLPSSLETRFEFVQRNTVHLECGPNTITKDTEGVTFSDLFFASGTRFLVSNGTAAKVDLKNGLQDIQTGVLEDTTTAEFLQENYPQAELTYFKGELGRMQGVSAVVNGNIDAFASDGVLLSGELDRQSLAAENYQLIPEEPLTCDFYGLLLPVGDREWRNLVNAFLRSKQQRRQRIEWLGDYFPKTLSDADYCLNRKNK